MTISDILFETEVRLCECLEISHDSNADDPLRQAISDLLAHINAVRRLSGIDYVPDEQPLQRVKSFVTSSDDAVQWDDQHQEETNHG